MKINHRSITGRFKILFLKLPKGVQKGLAWTIAVFYLFGLPYTFSSITRTEVSGFLFAVLCRVSMVHLSGTKIQILAKNSGYGYIQQDCPLC